MVINTVETGLDTTDTSVEAAILSFEYKNPVLLKGVVDIERAQQIGQAMIDLKNSNIDPTNNYTDTTAGYYEQSNIWHAHSSKSAFKASGIPDMIGDLVADIGLINEMHFNVVGYNPRATLMTHTDEINPKRTLFVGILQLIGSSTYHDGPYHTKADKYPLIPGDFLLTNGNRPHSAKNTGDTPRVLVSFFSKQP